MRKSKATSSLNDYKDSKNMCIWGILTSTSYMYIYSLHKEFSILSEILRFCTAYNSNWHDVTTQVIKTKGNGCSYSLAIVACNDNAFISQFCIASYDFFGNYGNYSFLFE